MTSNLKRWTISLLLLHLIWIAEAQSPDPYVSRSFPRDGDRGVMPNAFISLAIRLPGGEKGLNLQTLSNDNLLLYPANNPQKKIPVFPMAKTGLNNITIEPLETLQPEHTYILEVTSGLQTLGGKRFLPYQMRFTVGNFPITPRPERPSVVEAEPEPAEEILASQQPEQAVPVLPKVQEDSAFWREAHESALPQPEDFIDLPSISPEKPAEMAEKSASPLNETQAAILSAPSSDASPADSEVNIYSRPSIRLKDNHLTSNIPLELVFELSQQSTMALILRNHEGDALIRKAGMLKAGYQEMKLEIKDIEPGEYLLVVKTAAETFRAVIRID